MATPTILPQERQAILQAVGNLDDEGFNYIMWMVYQQSREAGGFLDKAGWAAVRGSLEPVMRRLMEGKPPAPEPKEPTVILHDDKDRG